MTVTTTVNGSDSQTNSVPVVREQVKKLAGFESREALREVVPDSTAHVETSTDEPRKRKPRTPAAPPTDPLMLDPKYAKAVAGMTAFGGARVIKGGFQAAALVTEKPDVALNSQEQEQWDDFFYVVGKKSNFDPTRPWYLILFSLVLLGEHVLTRLWKYNSESLSSQLAELFGFGDKKEPQTETDHEGKISDIA